MKVFPTACAIGLASFALLVCGCVPSLYPLFTPDDFHVEPALAGTWRTDDGNARWTFTSKGKAFAITTQMKDQPDGSYNGVLGKISDHLFLQLRPNKPTAIHEKSLYGGHFIPAFTIWKISIDGDELKVVPLNYQWLDKAIENQSVTIRHERQMNDLLVLTAPTEEFKAFILKWADDEDAFSDSIVFKRTEDE